jgi:hypothetical protein
VLDKMRDPGGTGRRITRAHGEYQRRGCDGLERRADDRNPSISVTVGEKSSIRTSWGTRRLDSNTSNDGVE